MDKWLRPFSYSSLKMFETCPKQYGEINVYKNFKNVFTSAKGDYGDRLHKVADAFVLNGGAIDAEFSFLLPALEEIRRLDGTKYTEHKMGITHEGAPVEWNDPNRWFQGIADLVVVNDSPIARVIDYKTGSDKYADTDQLELMALLVFSHFPHVKLVKGGLLFVLSRKLLRRTIDIREQERLMQKYRERDAKRIGAIENDNFPMKESGLCRKHCVVNTCPHNGRK